MVNLRIRGDANWVSGVGNWAGMGMNRVSFSPLVSRLSDKVPVFDRIGGHLIGLAPAGLDAMGAAIAEADIPSQTIFDYNELPAQNPGYVGNKCAQLAIKFNEGLPQPPGFNISIDFHRRYLLANPRLLKMLEDAREIDTNKPEDVDAFARRIQEFMVNQTTLPSSCLEELDKYLARYNERLGAVPRNAVRGSAPNEDVDKGRPEYFEKSTGAQPGQGTTLLNIPSTLAETAKAVLEVMAGQFNVQIFVYREIQLLFDFVKGMPEREYRQLIELARRAGQDDVAEQLTTYNVPGYIKLRQALQAIEKKFPTAIEQYHWAERLENSADEILNPFKLVTGIAILKMVYSYVAGTAFTADPGTGFDASTFAKKWGLFPADLAQDAAGYTTYMNVNFLYGAGPAVVEAVTEPDKCEMATLDGGQTWVTLSKRLGKKEMRLVPLHMAFEAIQHKMSEKKIRELATLYQQWLAPAGDQDRPEALTKLRRQHQLSEKQVEVWDRAMRDYWFFYGRPEKAKSRPEDKAALLKELGLTDDEFFTLAFLIKHLNGLGTQYRQMSYLVNPPEMRDQFSLEEPALQVLCRLIATIANINTHNQAKRGDNWRQRWDIEWAKEILQPGEKNGFSTPMDRLFDLVTGQPAGPGELGGYHLQNRSLTMSKEIEDPGNIVFSRRRIDMNYVREHDVLPIATNGLHSFGAAEGTIYVVDMEKSMATQEQEVRDLSKKGPVVVVLEEMGPEHDSIVAAVAQRGGGAIVKKGNDTSHAYIFSLEQRIVIVINPQLSQEKEKEFLANGKKAVLSGAEGEIWPGDKGIPLIQDDLKIYIDLLPEENRARLIVSTIQAGKEVARLGTGSALSRIEFIINQNVRIYPQAAHAYDILRQIESRQKKETDFTAREQADVRILRQNPEVIDQIAETIKGWSSAEEFIAENMRYAANYLGLLYPLGDKIRDYDNKEKEAILYDLIGAKLFLNYDDRDVRYDSPLVGMRGSALLTDPHLKKGFKSLTRGILRSIKDGFRNNSFFFVFLRTVDEFKVQLEDLAKLCDQEGVWPEEVGTMVEVPSNVWIIDDILVEAAGWLKAYPQVKKFFVSFGTNDLTNSTGKTSREDKDFTGNVIINDPDLLDIEPIEIDKGVTFGPKKKGEPWTITINDEGAPAVLRSIEHVTSRVRKASTAETPMTVSLCGQAVTKAIEQGRFDVATRIINALDSFGTQTINFVTAAMLDLDAKTANRILSKVDAAANPLLGQLSKTLGKGVMRGEVIYVDGPADIAKIREGKNKNKIVILRGPLGDAGDLDKEEIRWGYLKYARAILLAPGFDPAASPILKEKTIATRIKGTLKSETEIPAGTTVTLDYDSGRILEGEVAFTTRPVELKEIETQPEEPGFKLRASRQEYAADIFLKLGIHPLAFIIYDHNRSDLDPVLAERIEELLRGQNVHDFLTSAFYRQMVTEAVRSPEMPVIHNTLDLTRNQLRELAGGEEIELIKGKEGGNFDDPNYRLHGGARNLSDMWRIHSWELEAFNRAHAEHPENLRIQLSTMGTRSREILALQLLKLRKMGILPVRDKIGLRITTPADILYLQDYIDMGMGFFSYDQRKLAEGLLAANFDHPDLFWGREADMIEQALLGPERHMRSILSRSHAWLTIMGHRPDLP